MGCFNPQVNQGETINTKEGGRRIVIVKWNILVKDPPKKREEMVNMYIIVGLQEKKRASLERTL